MQQEKPGEFSTRLASFFYLWLLLAVVIWFSVVFVLDMARDPCSMITIEQQSISTTVGGLQWMFNCTAIDQLNRTSYSELQYDRCSLDYCVAYSDRPYFLPQQNGRLLQDAHLLQVYNYSYITIVIYLVTDYLIGLAAECCAYYDDDLFDFVCEKTSAAWRRSATPMHRALR